MSYVALATTTLANSSTSITFSSIPASFKDLVIVASGTSTSSVAETVMRFNGDSGSNYFRIVMFGTGSSAGTFANTGGSIGFIDAFTTLGMSIGQIMDYSSTDKHKTVLVRRSFPADSVASTAARWANTAAITSITLTCVSSSLAAGSTFSLFGIAG